jgi:hypothetical protein
MAPHSELSKIVIGVLGADHDRRLARLIVQGARSAVLA